MRSCLDRDHQDTHRRDVGAANDEQDCQTDTQTTPAEWFHVERAGNRGTLDTNSSGRIELNEYETVQGSVVDGGETDYKNAYELEFKATDSEQEGFVRCVGITAQDTHHTQAGGC